MPRRRSDPLTEIRARPGAGWDIVFDSVQVDTVTRGWLGGRPTLRYVVARQLKNLLRYGPEFGLYVPGRRR